jgi:2-isopropylmalate synthase
MNAAEVSATEQSRGVADVPRRVLIFDTTLRDGEQAPGFSMSRAQKLRVAHALADLGVDIIEAGFPIASAGDFESVHAIAGEVRGATICGLARAQSKDIETAARALEPAARPRIHVFLATSPLHREHKLNMSKAQVIDTAVAAIRRARELCEDVEFSAEDAIRTEPDYLAEVFTAALEAGARTLNVPDTVGYTTPAEMHARITYLRARVAGIENALNGIGERAGNAALEEIVMALHTRRDLFNAETGVRTTRLHPTARMFANLIGTTIPRNKAIVGDNAFAHESGIHQHGMLKHRATYEIMRPEDVGCARTSLVLGKHSGRHALRERLAMLGHELDEAQVDELFTRFKSLCDRKKEVRDSDLEALALGRDPDAAGPWHLTHLHATSHLGGSASAVVRIAHEDGRVASGGAIGDGPVDAVLRALGRAIGHELAIDEFHVRALGQGGDAQGQASLSIVHQNRELRGQAVSTDIIEATALAVLEIVNRIEHNAHRAAQARAANAV